MGLGAGGDPGGIQGQCPWAGAQGKQPPEAEQISSLYAKEIKYPISCQKRPGKQALTHTHIIYTPKKKINGFGPISTMTPEAARISLNSGKNLRNPMCES